MEKRLHLVISEMDIGLLVIWMFKVYKNGEGNGEDAVEEIFFNEKDADAALKIMEWFLKNEGYEKDTEYPANSHHFIKRS
ncbi:MAG: hypothetical protein PHD51_02425 [Patescibacteria group bacterium]|nr:hypothetical protein [Patescibacteria group bacterium]MDD5490283.1 hypothetical protein [Patescibacteria group bacterium]